MSNITIYSAEQFEKLQKEKLQNLSPQDYDNLMEKYLKDVRVARGYTLRQPSDYNNSPNARYKQDAQDWNKFLAEVMQYGLNVQNTYAQTGFAPTPDEFLKNMPTIEWTFKDN